MATIRITTACKEFDRLFAANSFVSDLQPLQELAMVSSALAVLVSGSLPSLPSSGQVPITSVQFQYPGQFGFTAVSSRTYLFNGVDYTANGSSLQPTNPIVPPSSSGLTNSELRASPVPVAPSVQTGAGAVTPTTQRVTLANDGPGVSALSSIAGMAVPAHDHITLGYTSGNLSTVTYRAGGAGGAVVATLTLGYTSGVLTTVTRS